jgi:hypothetical protein
VAALRAVALIFIFGRLVFHPSSLVLHPLCARSQPTQTSCSIYTCRAAPRGFTPRIAPATRHDFLGNPDQDFLIFLCGPLRAPMATARRSPRPQPCKRIADVNNRQQIDTTDKTAILALNVTIMVPAQSLPPKSRLRRAARIATICYVICCAVVLPLGLAAGILGGIHLFTASKVPKGDKTAQFKQGNTVLYNTPELFAWRDRLLVTGATGTAVLLLTGGTMYVL